MTQFITEDSARDGLNWYLYALGNPLIYLDPTGMFTRDGKNFKRLTYMFNYQEVDPQRPLELKVYNDPDLDNKTNSYWHYIVLHSTSVQVNYYVGPGDKGKLTSQKVLSRSDFEKRISSGKVPLDRLQQGLWAAYSRKLASYEFSQSTFLMGSKSELLTDNVSAVPFWQDPIVYGAVALVVIPELYGLVVPLAADGEPTNEISRAYEIAKQGGRHSGFYKQYVDKPIPQIEKGISSLRNQIAEHVNKIINPQEFIPHFNQLDPRQQEALINKKWPSDIFRQWEQMQILIGILKNKIEGGFMHNDAENFISDLIKLIQEKYNSTLTEDDVNDSFNKGMNFAYYDVLDLIQTQIVAFGCNIEAIVPPFGKKV